MSDLFSGDKLKERAVSEIGLMRNWLNSIEKQVNEDDRCVEASTILYLGESFAKLSYGVGMMNHLRLRKRRSTTNDKPHR